MKVGILGYSGVGKTSVFSALTGQKIEHPIPGEKHRGTVEVIDRRLDHMRDVFQPKKFTRARFDVEDLAPLPQGDLKGKGEILASLREPDAIVLVVGAFEQALLGLPESLQDPLAQCKALREDLLLLDMDIVEKRLQRLEERKKKGGQDKAALEREIRFVSQVQTALEQGQSMPEPENSEEARLLAEMRLFADKAVVVLFNREEGTSLQDADNQELLEAAAQVAVLCAPVEVEISQLEESERADFLGEYGLTEPASERLTRLASAALDLISFFTVGPDEVRAWPISRGSDAVTAAGKIHSDLARGFIRAEVVAYSQVQEAKDEREYKATSRPELKGKDYVVQDGDILNIRFNV